MKTTLLISIAHDYLSLLHNDGLDSCIRTSKHHLDQSDDATVKQFISDIGDHCYENLSLTGTETKEAFICFWYLYGLARYKIETSYEYKCAETILVSSTRVIDDLLTTHQNHEEKALLELLKQWVLLFVANARIDRGIYNSIPELLDTESAALSQQITRIHTIAARLDETNAIKQLYDEFIKDHINCYHTYSSTLQQASKLYQIRWHSPQTYQHELTQVREKFLTASQYLKACSNEDADIVRSDLLAHLPVLEKLALLRHETQGVLNINKADIEFSFFAALDHTQLAQFNLSIEQQLSHCLSLTTINAEGPVIEEMSDIWSGLASADYIKKYHWTLPETTLQFREQTLTLQGELHYYRMGIFCITLRAQVSNMSISEIRHLLGLGSPFTLDESLCFNDERFNFIREVADKVFCAVNDALVCQDTKSDKATKQHLLWNCKEHWFITLDTHEITESFTNLLKTINPGQILSHPTFSGIASPLKEVRVAIDNWVTSQTVNPADNIAPLRYSEHEFMYVQRNCAVVGLLEQPNWVRDQAKESLLVSALIANLLLISNNMLSNSLQELEAKPLDKNHAPLATITSKIEHLHQYESRLRTLLETIKLGTIVTYADHARLMNGIFKHIDFAKLTTNTHSVLTVAKQKHEQFASELSAAQEKSRANNEKRRDFFITSAALFLSVGAINDFFQIFERDSSLQITTTVAILSLIIIVIFVLWLTRDKNPS